MRYREPHPTYGYYEDAGDRDDPEQLAQNDEFARYDTKERREIHEECEGVDIDTDQGWSTYVSWLKELANDDSYAQYA